MKPSCPRTGPAPGRCTSLGQLNANQSRAARPMIRRNTGSNTKRFSSVPERMLAPSVQPESPLPSMR
jgi:hypothetical protein